MQEARRHSASHAPHRERTLSLYVCALAWVRGALESQDRSLLLNVPAAQTPGILGILSLMLSGDLVSPASSIAMTKTYQCRQRSNPGRRVSLHLISGDWTTMRGGKTYRRRSTARSPFFKQHTSIACNAASRRKSASAQASRVQSST